MDYKVPSQKYLRALSRTTNALVELCSLHGELKGVHLKDPKTDEELSHESTLRQLLVLPYMHYLNAAAVEALKNGDNETYSLALENFRKLMIAESKIPSRVQLMR